MIAQTEYNRLMKASSHKKDGKAELGLIGLAIVAFNSDFTCIFCGQINFDVLDASSSVEHRLNHTGSRKDVSTISIACTSCNRKDGMTSEKNYFVTPKEFVLPNDSQLIDTLKIIASRNIESFQTRVNQSSGNMPLRKELKSVCNDVINFVQTDKTFKLQMLAERKKALLAQLESLNLEIESLG